jgi:hypothetical protein
MTRPKLSSLFLFCSLAALAIAVVPLRASDPVGAYAIVEKVVLEPNATEPAAVRVFGVFSLAVRREANGTQPWPPGSFGTANTGDVYAAVQKGYLYYMCTRGQEATCRNEWRDLKAVAGTPEVIGFGSRWAMMGRVRTATEKASTPDIYPLNVGLVKMGIHGGTTMPNRSQYPDLIAALQAAARAR